MPKFPLFENQPLHDATVLVFWLIRRHPEIGANAGILEDIATIRNKPENPMPKRLVSLVVELGLTRSASLDNILWCDSESQHYTPKWKLARLQINHRVIAHDNAAALFSTPLPDSSFASLLKWLAERPSKV